MKYSERFLYLAGMMAITLLIRPSSGAEEKDIFLRMSAEGKSEEEVFAYVKSLTPKALLRLGRELSADPTWIQPASGIEYVTSVILSTYADKVGRTAITSPFIREIGDGNLPDKWRLQVLSWFCSKALEPADESWVSAADAEILTRSLLVLVINTQERNDLRHEANANLAHLLTARYESAIKVRLGSDRAARVIYEEHLKWLTTRAKDLSAEPDFTGATIMALAIYERFGVAEASEIRGALLSAFRHRERMADQDKVLLAEVLVESGEGNKIRGDLEDCVQKVADPALRRKCRKLLNQLPTSDEESRQGQSK